VEYRIRGCICFREVRIRMSADTCCLLVGETGVHNVSCCKEALRELPVPVQGKELEQ